MSTNYFKPTNYAPPRVISNPAADIPAPQLLPVDTSSPDYQKYGALTGGTNYQERQRILGKLSAEGDQSLYQNFLRNMGAKRDTFSARLAGYGGLSFKTDDPSTTKREDFEIEQRTGQTGQREVAGVQGATASAASSGIRGRARNLMIGAALQRVSEEARGIINQYAAEISGTQEGGLAYEFQRQQEALVRDWGDLYGKDAKDAFAEELRQNAATTAATQAAQRAAQQAAEQDAFNRNNPVGRVAGQWGTKAFAENAIKQMRKAGKYPEDKFDLKIGKPGGKNYYVIMASKK
jgi:hypothetical protein